MKLKTKWCSPRFQRQRPYCEYPWLSGIILWLPHFPSHLQSPSQDWLSPSVSVSLMPGPSVHTSSLLHQASCREPCFCCLIVLIAMWYFFSYSLLAEPFFYQPWLHIDWNTCKRFIQNYFAPAIAVHQNSNCNYLYCVHYFPAITTTCHNTAVYA